MLPFTLVESKTFSDFISTLNEKYAIPSRITIKNIIVSKFNAKRSQIKQDLEKVNSKISFTTDIWTNLSNEAFMGVTAHYIDDNWNLRSFTLDIIPLEEKHTGNYIALKIQDILEEFDLCSKTLAITTDNASNAIKGCSDFSNILENCFSNCNFI